nr:SpoIIE family protein phosphatase [Peptoniphilus sp. KCTC 25270]
MGLLVNHEKLNTQILDGIADMIRIVNKDNEVVYFNDAMEKFFSGNTNLIVCEMDQEEGQDSFCDMRITERCLSTGEVIQREESVGEDYYSVKTNPIFGDNGSIIGAIEVFRNKSTEKKLQIELIERNKSLMEEMQAARNIQQALLPTENSIKGIDLNYLYRPASALSGDVFDVYEIDEDHIALYIADVVGHGFSSSMTTMFIFQTLRNMQKKILKNPALTMEELNKRFLQLGLSVEIYFTLFYGVFNRKTKEFTYTNAGHNCPPMVKQGEDITLLEASGYPINRLFSEHKYEAETIQLKDKSQILLYTDGIVEYKNIDRIEFGIQRLKEIFETYTQHFFEELDSSLRSFVYGEPIDDITCALIQLNCAKQV